MRHGRAALVEGLEGAEAFWGSGSDLTTSDDSPQQSMRSSAMAPSSPEAPTSPEPDEAADASVDRTSGRKSRGSGSRRSRGSSGRRSRGSAASADRLPSSDAPPDETVAIGVPGPPVSEPEMLSHEAPDAPPDETLPVPPASEPGMLSRDADVPQTSEAPDARSLRLSTPSQMPPDATNPRPSGEIRARLSGHGHSIRWYARLRMRFWATSRRTLCLAAVLLVALIAATAGLLILLLAGGGNDRSLPAGVNLGGWLALEDWLFSGTTGRYVRSPSLSPQGVCLPPNVASLATGPWGSEGVLTAALVTALGTSSAIAALNLPRQMFANASDFRMMARFGIRTVRVPLSWATFAEELTRLGISSYGSHDPDTEVAIVPDPYYTDKAAFATVPRKWLADALADASAAGLTVLLELHSLPGGAASGSFNGVWPEPPVFWSASVGEGASVYPLTEVGLWLAGALVKWVEGLNGTARKAVGGLCFMNEPALLAASEGFVSGEAVLSWLASAAALFRNSSLPGSGVKLYVNLAESAFADFEGSAPPWWSRTFSADERSKWAVADQHTTFAWSSGTCDGRNTSGGGYRCGDDLANVRKVLRGCAVEWASSFANRFGGLRACTAFSLGTFQDAWEACNSTAILDIFFKEQLAAFSAHAIESHFWTWRAPYAPAFRVGWSLAHYLGLENPLPAVSCGMVEAEEEEEEVKARTQSQVEARAEVDAVMGAPKVAFVV
eukprot:NODE_74_length_3832_cov_3.957355.p1 GENE.NODE_74_length_3832_cov_3.957355~~NODE_74_length_3832_cov_3.957355.p1  ORF type:complete len:725 (+),score=202.99 NODE_74_length_3832_cov_3.957355:1496-3670(+)